MKRINRPEYLDFLIRSKERQIIKVVSGIRRCGKSTLFDIYRDWLSQNGVAKEQIISVNFEDIGFESLNNYRPLCDIGAGTNHNGIRQLNVLDWLLDK